MKRFELHLDAAISVIASVSEAIQNDALLKISTGLLHFVRNDGVFFMRGH